MATTKKTTAGIASSGKTAATAVKAKGAAKASQTSHPKTSAKTPPLTAAKAATKTPPMTAAKAATKTPAKTSAKIPSKTPAKGPAKTSATAPAKARTKATPAQSVAASATAKAVSPDSKRTPNAAFMKPMTPSAALAKIVGAKALPRTEVTRKLWEYIKEHKLQDPVNKRQINGDAALAEVFGKPSVTMFEMTQLVGKHLS